MTDGVIVAAHGRHFLVDTGAGESLECVTRGRRGDLACGDRVTVAVTAPGAGVIEHCAPRTTLLKRAAAHREKLLAANVTQVAIVTAVDPSFADEMVARIIAAAEAQSIRGLIVLNKTDLPGAEAARARLAPFADAGYPIVEIAAKRDVAPLAARLAGESTVLVGQSGMGKSTIVNALVPDANAATAEISRFLASGRHTTTAARRFALSGGGTLVDSPGVQAFGVAHLARAEIEHGFVEVRPALGRCRFADCRHASEPDCAVRALVAAGAMHPRRFKLMQRIVARPGG